MSAERDFVIERLREAPVFETIPAEQLRRLAGEVETVYVNAGATLTTQGEPAEGAYLLVSGRLRAFANQPDGSEAVVGEVAAGELVGEMALISATNRSATVRAVRDSHLLFVRSATFNQLVHHNPEATLAIARVLVERLERANSGRAAASPRRTLAVFAAAGDGSAVIDRLCASLAATADVKVVDAATVDAALGPGHSEAELVHWLHRLEAAAELVVYRAGDLDETWTRRCLRQADHVIALDADPGTAEVERVIARLDSLVVGTMGPTMDALCVHPARSGRPMGGARWTSSPHIQVHHIRRESAVDLQRVARSILHRDIAVVLSGGGARGMAHVGVLRAFEEAAIPIDVIGGASFGAIVAMMRALDMDWRAMREALWETVGRDGPPIDLTAPAVAFSKGQRLSNILLTVFDDARLEDTWLRSFAVSSNLSTGHPLVHTSGSIVEALRASIAIPGIFPPAASDDGEVLVDGALMNNLPVDVMTQFSNGGPIVAVNLRSPAELAAGELPANGVISGWRTLGRRLRPFRRGPAVPSLMEILMRSTEIGGAEATRTLEQSADYVLHPPVEDHEFLDFAALDDLVSSGYESTREQLATWEATGRSLRP